MIFRGVRGRAQRRAWPIMAYTGPNGSGKSAAMVWDTLPSLDAGRQVLSTVRLIDWRAEPDENGDRPDHPCWVELSDWQQLLDAEHCDVLLDEVTGVASSRESASLPAPVANKLVQLRRADVVVRWSAPSWMRADKIIRETSQAVTFCHGYLARTAKDEDRQWRERRLFRWATYDALEFDEFTEGKREGLSAVVNDWHWGPGSACFAAYDTYDAVSHIGTVSDTGRCYRCGGRRSVPTCKCDRDGAPSGAGAERGTPERGRSAPRPRHAEPVPLPVAADSG